MLHYGEKCGKMKLRLQLNNFYEIVHIIGKVYLFRVIKSFS